MCTEMLKTKAVMLSTSLAMLEQEEAPLTRPRAIPATISPPENMRPQVVAERPHFLHRDLAVMAVYIYLSLTCVALTERPA